MRSSIGRLLFLLTITLLIPGCATFGSGEKDTVDLQLRLAQSYVDNEQFPQAIQTLLQAEKVAPDNPLLHNMLGAVYFIKERYELAEKHYRLALRIDPNYTDVKNNLGQLLVEKGSFKEALFLLTQASNDLTYQNPEKPMINLGIAHFKMKNYHDAQRSFLRALTIQRNNCFAQSFLGRTFFEQREFKRSIDILDKAIGFCQEAQFDEPHYYSGLAFLEVGQKMRASSRFEEVIKLYPNGRYSERARTMLEGLKR